MGLRRPLLSIVLRIVIGSAVQWVSVGPVLTVLDVAIFFDMCQRVVFGPSLTMVSFISGARTIVLCGSGSGLPGHGF